MVCGVNESVDPEQEYRQNIIQTNGHLMKVGEKSSHYRERKLNIYLVWHELSNSV